MGRNVNSQFKNNANDLEWFALALDESKDVSCCLLENLTMSLS